MDGRTARHHVRAAPDRGAMSAAIERALGALVTANNRSVRARALDRDQENPRPITSPSHWNTSLESQWPALRAEWDSFASSGGRLPRIEDLIHESQGNEGTWRAGLLVSRGAPVPALADRFAATQAALSGVPGLWSALWSVLEPGAILHEHVGPNAGVLRYHLGIDCGTAAALQVGGVEVPYRDGVGILFDDTVPHAAWNRGPKPRVTLFLEVIRPVPGPAGALNRSVQQALALDPRYRRAPRRAAEWDVALNGPPNGERRAR